MAKGKKKQILADLGEVSSPYWSGSYLYTYPDTDAIYFKVGDLTTFAFSPEIAREIVFGLTLGLEREVTVDGSDR